MCGALEDLIWSDSMCDFVGEAASSGTCMCGSGFDDPGMWLWRMMVNLSLY